MIFSEHPKKESYDVLICGGGLAGQTLARQLKLNYPDISVAILEKTVFPLPLAACKVGESTVEIAGFYFAESLELNDYFKNNQLTKLGLRYYYGDSSLCLSERPELGLSKFPSYDSFQIDRGSFENDLCEMNKLVGVDIFEGVSVQEIDINDADDVHEVKYKIIDDDSLHSIKGRWVIDAMGRRSFLQRKFKLRVKIEDNHSAAWFRVPVRLDVDDFVPLSNKAWHQRMPHKIRYYSTTHLMGHGYWVWLIPLASGITSVGIVTAEKIHPISTYNSQVKAMEWLEKFEPVVYAHLTDVNFLDFITLKNYAHSSRQLFSTDRWACVGESGVFSDPFYSPGSNMIGFGNTMVTRMIGLDRNKKLTPEIVNSYDNFALSYQEWLIQTIHPSYSYFGNAQVMSLNYLWDVTVGWSITAPQMFNSIYLDNNLSSEIRKITASYSAMAIRIKQLFKDWENCAAGSFTFKFIDYLEVPFIKEIYDRNLKPNKTPDELIADHRINVDKIQEFAQVIFLLVIEDTMPENLALFSHPVWINPEAVSLHPDKWEKDGLFKPKNEPRDLQDVKDQVRSLYTFKNQEPQLQNEELLNSVFDFKFNV
jgi:flavin-dependent dehydrogenase